MIQSMYLPATSSVAGLLTQVVNRRVLVGTAPPVDLRSSEPRLFGVYRSAQKGCVCLAVCDLEFCAYLAAAMLAFPLGTVNDVIRAGSLGASLLDTVQEILTLCSHVFDSYGDMVLQQVFDSPSALPQQAADVLRSPAGRLDLTVAIPDYGSGKMTFLIEDRMR